MAWLTGYTYRRAIVVTEATGGTLTDYQVKLSILSTSFGAIQSLAQDVRVTDSDGITLLDYWVESFDGSANLVVWTKIPSLTASSARTLYVYYGNSGAADAQAFSSVFVKGNGFDSGFGDLTARTSGSGTATRLAEKTSWNDSRWWRVWRCPETPVVSGSDLGTDYVRELTLLVDVNGEVIEEGGVVVGYAAGRNATTGVMDAFRSTSTDRGLTWGSWTQVLSHGTAGLDSISASPSCVIRLSANDYRMWYWARDSFPGLVNTKIAWAHSSDGITWVKDGVLKDGSDLVGQPSGVPDAVGVAYVTPLADGTFIMVAEGQKTTGGASWLIYGWTAANVAAVIAGTWTPMNSGNALLTYGAGGTWDDAQQANPKVLQLPDGSLLMQYNGGDDITDLNFQIGFATAATPAGAWTKDANNPMMGKATGSYGIETSDFRWFADGSLCSFNQIFASTSVTAQIFRTYPVDTRGATLVTPSVADAAFVGMTLAAGTFVVNHRHTHAFKRGVSASSIPIGLYDLATVPVADASTNWTAQRRLEIDRPSRDSANIGNLRIAYWDTGGTKHYWDGSAWQTSSSTFVAADIGRTIDYQLTDDGTNFTTIASYADTGTLITSAPIAKASVKTFTNGRVVWSGDPFKDNWCFGQFLHFSAVRKYAATEPSVSAGAEDDGVVISSDGDGIGNLDYLKVRAPRRPLRIKRSEYSSVEEYKDAVSKAAGKLAVASVPLAAVSQETGDVIGDDILADDEALLMVLTKILH